MAEGSTYTATNVGCTQRTKLPQCVSKSKTANAVSFADISAIFFDLDNTLIPTRTGDSKACRKLTEVLESQFGFTKDESSAATQSFLKSFRRCPDNSQTSLDSWRTFLWREALPDRYKHRAEQIYERWLQLRYRYLALPSEYVQLLQRCRELGLLLALITNGPSNAQWEKINRLNVSQYFDCVLVSSDLPWEKPNPNIFYTACNFLGVEPVKCGMIGDKLESDIKGGRLSGLGATFWLPLSTAEIDLSDVAHPPDVILRNLLDISKYINVLHAPSTSGGGHQTASNQVAANAQLSTRRRPSQISFGQAATTSAAATTTTGASSMAPTTTVKKSTTTTTNGCDHGDLHGQVRSYRVHSQLPMQQQQQHQQQMSKYRRGGSLPANSCTFNSDAETENSSDSIMN